MTDTRFRVLGLAICALLGAGLNVYRTGYFVHPAVREWNGFQNGATQTTGEPVHTVRSYASILTDVPDWRPLRLRLLLRAPDAAAGQTVGALLEADHRTLGTVRVSAAQAEYEFLIRSPASTLRRLTVQVNADVDGPHGPGLDVDAVSLAPVLTVVSVLRYGAIGAAIGATAFLLFMPFRPPSQAQAKPQPPVATAARVGQSGVAAAAVTISLLLYFAVWALIKPPFQVADEPQHLMRAAAILKTPWLTQFGTFPHDLRFLNPLALWHPPALWKVIYPHVPLQSMTRDDVQALKSERWRSPQELAHQEPYHIALASYPTLYYWVVFAGGQLATSMAGLSPYDSLYAYRAASLIGATVLWVFVYRLLRELFAGHAAILLAFLVLNPMVANLTSSVSADAFAIPLGTLAVLACWRTLSTGTRPWSATGWLLLGAFAKPSGLQIMATVAAVALLLAMTRAATWPHARLTLIAVGRAAVPAWLLFYAWSPTIFTGSPVTIDVPTYILRFLDRLPVFWIYFWGLLGWMDYQLSNPWYLVLFLMVAINLVCLWWKPGAFHRYDAFALLVFASFIASTAAGEFVYLKDAGYVIHGRYFLPAIVGLTPLMLHRVWPARYGLIVMVALMNVLLLHATIVRCYGGDYGTLWVALPFVSAR